MIQRLAPFTALALLFSGCTTDASEDPVTGAALEIEQSATAVTGTYARAGSLIEFAARTVDDQVAVHLDVNGLAFDVTLDQLSGTLRHDGHSGTIFIEDRDALTAMAGALRDKLSLTPDMPMHEQILVRAVSFLSEAPPGYTLSPREHAAPIEDVISDGQGDGTKVPRAGTRIYEDLADGGEAFLGMADGHGNVISDPDKVAALEVNQACYQSGEDGILYLTSATSVPKTTTWYRWAEHDCGSHCYAGKSVLAGPGSYKCKGECGPGCYGSGVYSYDCMDHDQCCREGYSCFSSSDSSCGDEYKEADDDFWWGRILWLY